ncbi:helix-turn-helix domain-containing protein [Labrys wisconsinensis]|uniref:Transcriptional regulator with XRE-family HTH domain n=1 Tax=Labrys wisconsinensis TaxID=425677 RepID=A0ABU0J9L2_9HYPH|nr:helix-turn-helix transcriptional regulator [Labrys wisconsinensis]MDQ0470965.1 transcriptional regulator with XRE-family HTH domain [Labrys wisconsinensis]
MTLVADSAFSDEQSRAIAAAVREALARRRISRQRLADEARISISTLEKALAGRRPFTLATTIRLEEALGVRLRRAEDAAPASSGGLAPDALGSYARPAVRWIEGSYLTLRPSFGDVGAIYAYRTEIGWDEQAEALAFRESERLDTAFTQFGSVSVPNQSGHIYLVTNRHGQHRLIVLGRPTIAGAMYGILTTLQAGRGSQLTPVSAPIALVPIGPGAAVPAFGRVTPAERWYSAYRDQLAKVTEDGFAMFLASPRG